MSKPRALITGAGGFVGSHLAKRLQAEGWSITPIDPRLPPDPLPTHLCSRWQDIVGQLRNSGSGFDCVFHLAANILPIDKRMAGGLDSYGDIETDYAFLQWVEGVKPGRVVLMSSCAVDAEDDPYGFCKVALEKFAAKLSVPHVVLRPFSGYSHMQALSYPFPSLWKQVTDRRDPVTVWGDLATVRDWVHAEDIVCAILWAATNAPTDSRPFEIGTGIGTSFLDLVQMMTSAVGYSPRIVADTSKPTSTRSRVADTRYAAKHGFSTKIGLEVGIQRAVEWAKAQRETHVKVQGH